MAKVQRIPLGRKPGQVKIELPDEVQLRLADLAGRTHQGLLAFAVDVGLEVFLAILHEDVAGLAGPKGRHDPNRTCYRHSTQESSVVLGGRRVPVSRQRVRSLSGEEMTLPTWAAFQGEELLCQMATERMLAGLLSRRYPVGLEPVGIQGAGTSKSAVSRRFIEHTKAALRELTTRDLSGLSICAVFADGLELADHTIVAAIGVDQGGNKHVLGLKEGSTENATVCTGLLTDLVSRGLDVSGGVLLVLDGGKGWRKAVREVFGELVLVQRCRLHKERNLLGYLPKNVHASVRRRLRKAWGGDDAKRAAAELEALARDLERAGHTSAAGSVREGLEETLTIMRLHLPPAISRTVFSTNIVESSFSVARQVMGRHEELEGQGQLTHDRAMVRRRVARRRVALPPCARLQGDRLPRRCAEDSRGEGVGGRC